ncbi:TetR family transcriptional regulator [Nocardia sp. NPDC047038]|uniref:TetR/AcrR family transcriptional regulator n=1 Tax=Nocardia sp. NPDC047038 TaxID=3154338 RepID=UPI0033C01497
MSKPVGREPLRRNARSNRARILATAREELGRNPDVTLEELARAAGVVRRTLFGHFPGRAALLEALAEEAAETFRNAVEDGPEPGESAERALAWFVLRMWRVGDRYRMLVALTRRDLGSERFAEVLAPAREAATGIVERGQRDGVFHTHLPPAVQSASLMALIVALVESVNTGALEDDGHRIATATLIAAGVPEARASAVVEEASAMATALPAHGT